jgi:hypothetical protein
MVSKESRKLAIVVELAFVSEVVEIDHRRHVAQQVGQFLESLNVHQDLLEGQDLLGVRFHKEFDDYQDDIQ